MKSIALLWAVLFCGGGLVRAVDLASLPEPYCHVRLMEFNPHGWYSNSTGIEELFKKYRFETAVEVGSWMGASTRHIARLLPPEGKLYAVDTWKGSPNENHDPQILATLYDQFLSNVIWEGLTDKIVPVRMDSLEAASQFSQQVDFIYLDATHEYEAVLNDLRAWYPLLKDGGIFSGDDWWWGDRQIEKAVNQFVQEKGLIVYTNGWFWYFQKKASAS